jgi:hypothetical protein
MIELPLTNDIGKISEAVPTIAVFCFSNASLQCVFFSLLLTLAAHEPKRQKSTEDSTDLPTACRSIVALGNSCSCRLAVVSKLTASKTVLDFCQSCGSQTMRMLEPKGFSVLGHEMRRSSPRRAFPISEAERACRPRWRLWLRTQMTILNI